MRKDSVLYKHYLKELDIQDISWWEFKTMDQGCLFKFSMEMEYLLTPLLEKKCLNICL